MAAALILAERTGKAVRSPAKSALLADAAGQIGMGRGLGVHKALDQIGAFTGPLLVAALVAATTGALWPGLAALALPGAVTMALLVLTRSRTPHTTDTPASTTDTGPSAGDPERAGPSATAVPRPPAPFLRFASGTALSTAGLVTFGLISFHLIDHHLLPTAGVPVLYAAAMAAGALAALATGEAYDRFGPGSCSPCPSSSPPFPPWPSAPASAR